MAPIIDAVIIGIVLASAAWLARRRHPAGARKALRARCTRYLAANPRSRREFTRIIREAVRIADEERFANARRAVADARLVGADPDRASGACGVSGVVQVAKTLGVPIQLVFDWQEGAFSYPPQEVYLRAGAVASIWDWLGPPREAPPRRGGFIPAGEVAKALAAAEMRERSVERLAIAEAAGRDLSSSEILREINDTENVRSEKGRAA